MATVKAFFLSRKTVLVLFMLILGTVAASAFFPQKFLASPENLKAWGLEHPFLASWYRVLGFDHAFTTPWFAAFLLLFLISLVLSSIEQFTIAWNKTRSVFSPQQGEPLRVPGPARRVQEICAGRGYFRIREQGGRSKWVRHPWGYWGNFLLHFGMVVVICASLVLVLTEKRGLLSLREGEVFHPENPWTHEELGLAAGEFILPFSVRLDAVRLQFWQDFKPRTITSDVSFLTGDGDVRQHAVSVSDKLSHKGLLVYQYSNFGHAFALEFTDAAGRRVEQILELFHPDKPHEPRYRDFELDWMPYRLQTKYYADADRKSFDHGNPLLVLRLKKNNEIVGEQLSLKAGEAGTLGGYTVRLVRVCKWSEIIFNEVKGMPIIFVGFFIIIAGCCLHYFTPPRVLLLREERGTFEAEWHGTRFAECYDDEREQLLAALVAEARK